MPGAVRRLGRPVKALDGVLIDGKQIVIYVDLDGAEWLASELPPSDGFTRELHQAIEQLREADG